MAVWMHLLGALHQVQDVHRMTILGWAGGRPGHGVLTYKCKQTTLYFLQVQEPNQAGQVHHIMQSVNYLTSPQ